jgi:hypothetical protein
MFLTETDCFNFLLLFRLLSPEEAPRFRQQLFCTQWQPLLTFSSCNSPHFFTPQQQAGNNNQQQASQQQATIIRQASPEQQAPRVSSLESQQQHGNNGSIG